MSRAFLDKNNQYDSYNGSKHPAQQKVDPELQMEKLDMDINNPGWNTTSYSPAQMFAEEEEERQAKNRNEEEEVQTKSEPGNPGTQTSMPDKVQQKMEGSFGQDFGEVNIHKDSGQAKNMGALAYTQGKDIHFAPGQYNPGTKKGQELLGHELTHVVQQREGKVKTTPAQRKREAEVKAKQQQSRETLGMHTKSPEAQMQLKLKYGETQLKADIARKQFNQSKIKQFKRGSSDRRQFTSKTKQFEQMLVQRKIAYGSEQYQQLIQACFPDHNPPEMEMSQAREKVAGTINNDPGLEKEADNMGKAAAQGKFVDKQAAVQAKSAGGNQKLNQKGEEEEESIKAANMLDQIMPVGSGILMNGEVGATFGIPVGLTSKAYTHLYRKNNDILVLRKFYNIDAGLDTSVGVGFHVGSKKGGLAAEVGADGEVKLDLYTDLEYEFPFKDDRGLLSAIFAVKKQTPLSYFIYGMIRILDDDSRINPYLYLKRFNAAVGLKAKGVAEAKAGIGDGDGKNTSKSSSGKNRNEVDKKTGSPGFLLDKLSLSASAMLEGSRHIGVEGKILERDPLTHLPTRMRGNVFFDASQKVKMGTSLNLLGIEMQPGITYKLVFDYTQEKDWQYKNVSVAARNGEMDFHRGAASELELGLSGYEEKAGDEDKGNMKRIADNMKRLYTGVKEKDTIFEKARQIAKYIQTIKLTKRFPVRNNLLKGYTKVDDVQELDNWLTQTPTVKNLGVSLDSYLTLGFDLSKVNYERVFQLAWDAIKKSNFKEVLTGIQNYFSNGYISKPIQNLLLLMINRETLVSAEWFSKAEAGSEITAKVGFGVKFAIHLGANLGVTYIFDVRNEILEKYPGKQLPGFFTRGITGNLNS